jgi:molybdate transport system regulatory protein
MPENALASGPAQAGQQVRGRVWVEKDGQTFLSWGRVVLLQRIAEQGSLAAAARSMGMGYRHAWSLVQEMNTLAGEPLVVKRTGGTRGGGAELTPAGQAAMARFWALVEEFQAWLDERQD